MLSKVIHWSLEHCYMVLALAVLLVIGSIYFLREMPIEVFPELNAPTVTIMTEAPGYSAEEVEKTISFQIESSLNGIPGLRRLRSSSTMGLSIVWAEFDFGADIYRNRQLVSERLNQIRSNLPSNIHTPELTPVASIAGEILLLGLVSPDESISPFELRKIAEFDLRPRLLAVTGVAQVTAMGGKLPEYQILVDPTKLSRYNLTYDHVVKAAADAHSIVGGGYLTNYQGRELPVRPLTQVRNIEDLKLTIIGNMSGVPILLSDVADIQIGGTPSRGTGSANGKPAVILTVQRNPSLNTLNVTKKIDEVLDVFEKSLPSGIELKRNIFRQSDFISTAINNVVTTLKEGALFVVIILIVFLMNVRTTLIILTALPLSLGAGILVLYAWGETINVMTLGGFAVAIGSLVDDAIVDVENFFRRARENHALPESQRKSTFQVVYEASIEIRPAIILATFIIVLVFVPLYFLAGVEGKFFRPLANAYVFSILASLVVAMTVTPVLCYLFFKDRHAPNLYKESALGRRLKNGYRSVLDHVLNARKAVLVASTVLLLCSLLLGRTFGSSFLPDFNEGNITLFLNTPIGTSLEESDRAARQVENQITQLPGVISVTRRTGRAENDEHAEPVSASEIDIKLDPEANIKDVKHDLFALLDNAPGLTSQVGGPIAHRLSHILSGTPAAIAIKIFGDDMAVLREIAKKVELKLKTVPGIRDLVANREAMIKTLPLSFDREKLVLYGFSPSNAAKQIETAILGSVVGVVNEGSSRINIVVRLKEGARQSIDDIKKFELQSPSGKRVTVEELATVFEDNSSMLITRENLKRKVVVSSNVSEGYNLGDLIASVRKEVNPIISQYPGVYVEYGGQFEAQAEASRRIFWSSLVVLFVIVVVLCAAYNSWQSALLILLNLPLALVGGIIALFISDSPNIFTNAMALFGIGNYIPPVVSISALVGFIGLAGIACRNGLLLVSHYQTLQAEGASKEEIIIRGSEERLIPILMTALSSGLALIPILLAKDKIGSELQYPVAVVIFGGLITSTFLNLFVIPAAFSLFGDWTKRTKSL